MRKIQVGIIGTGMWGKTHIRHFQKSKRAAVRWVCAHLDTLVQEARKAFQVPRGTVDYRQMLADPELDAVVIATPPHRHARLQPKFAFVRDFIQSGKLDTVYHIHHVMASQEI